MTIRVLSQWAPAPKTAPNCFLCDGPSEEFQTALSNDKVNAGRPYYKCVPCNNFLVFNDTRGNDPNNPPCKCGYSTKRQLAGPEAQIPWGVYYVCRLGTCSCYMPYIKSDGRQLLLDEVSAWYWIKQGAI